MTNEPRCDHCGQVCADGDEAEVIEKTLITVAGSQARSRVVEVLLCAPECPPGLAAATPRRRRQ